MSCYDLRDVATSIELGRAISWRPSNGDKVVTMLCPAEVLVGMRGTTQ